MLEDFRQPLSKRWTQTTIGGGALTSEDAILRLSLAETLADHYSDAQIDDYGKLARVNFPWRPPLRMEVEARASLPAADTNSTTASAVLRGTAGFGFWNYPFSVRGDILMLPEAVWFFYASPPSNMALVPGLPGWGWKAQVVHAMRPGALLSTPPMVLSTALAVLSGKTAPAARWMQRLSGAHEALLQTELTTWHRYTLEWHAQEALFSVDGELVLRAPNPPVRPLGFVAWLDNQFAVATPRGVLRFGSVKTGAQWCEISQLRIESL
ncbi:MAG TPA: hypothetical protein VGD98_00715 [Ktedonobacteraceae bacterium]